MDKVMIKDLIQVLFWAVSVIPWLKFGSFWCTSFIGLCYLFGFFFSVLLKKETEVVNLCTYLEQ